MGTYLITGAGGFVGYHLAEKLLQRGDKVKLLDISEIPLKDESATLCQADVRDKKRVFDAVQGCDGVFHTAALVPLTKSGKTFWDVNVNGTQNVLEAALEFKVKKFIHISSSSVYGIPPSPIHEDSPLKPCEIYGESKLEGERRVLEAAKKGLSTVIIRPRTIVGTRRLGIFQILFEWIRENRNIYLIGDGSNLFQFIHIDDLIASSLAALDQNQEGIFNIGTDRFGCLKEDMEALIRHAGSKSIVKGLPVSLTIGTLKTLDFLHLTPLARWHYLTYHKPYYFDISKAIRQLKWKPQYSNVEIFCEAYDWYLKNHVELKKSGKSAHQKPAAQKILRLIKWIS